MLYPIELRALRLVWYILINGRGGEIRTPDPLLPKQLRYQAALHPEIYIKKLARPERFELPTARFVAGYSIQLSYGRAVPHA